jgi:hypothetical protein
MRIRILRAFSGNNSGSYVLVGTFREAKAAEALASELQRVFEAHGKWLETQGSLRADTSPLHEYATDQGLNTSTDVGTGDEWPTYGTTPTALHVDGQVLVFVDYSVTFPSFVGELVYKRGGRVSVELDHSHEPIVLSHTIWKHEGWNAPEDAQRAVDAFRADVEDGALAELYVDPSGKLPSRPPILANGFWSGNVQLVHAPHDVGDGVRAVAALAGKHGLRTRFSLFETPVHGADPLGGYRRFESAAGAHQAVLWKAGPDVAATVRAVRGATGLGVAEATELVARAPIEVIVGVSEREALAARDALVLAGADAEVLGPPHFRR